MKWEDVEKIIESIAKERESVAKSNEKYRKNHPELFDECGDPVPIDDISFDDEDAANGSIYLGDDVLVSENMSDVV